MKTSNFIYTLLLVTTSLFVITSCADGDDDDNNATPNVYLTAAVKFNNTAPEIYTSNEYTFNAIINNTGNDTLIFEGERSSDASYMYFNLITEDIYSFTAGDSITIPYDFTSDTEVFCSLLINSVSTEIFQPGLGIDQGKVYIDEIDFNKKYMKGRFYGKFYGSFDSLEVANGSFLIDE